MCVSCFTHGCDKYPTKWLQERGVCLTRTARRTASWQGKEGGRRTLAHILAEQATEMRQEGGLNYKP